MIVMGNAVKYVNVNVPPCTSLSQHTIALDHLPATKIKEFRRTYDRLCD
jgi:hypothetical protein